MGFINVTKKPRLQRRISARPAQKRAAALSSDYQPYKDFLESWDTEKTTSMEKKLGIPALWLALVIEADRFAGIPLRIFRKERDGQLTQIHGHPIAELFNTRPNAMQDTSSFRHALTTQRRLRGNHYSYINRVNGRVMELNPLDPDCIEVLTTKRRIDQLDMAGAEVGDYLYAEKADGLYSKNNRRLFKRNDIFHVMWLTYDGYNGHGLDIFNERIRSMLIANSYGMTWFKNSVCA